MSLKLQIVLSSFDDHHADTTMHYVREEACHLDAQGEKA